MKIFPNLVRPGLSGVTGPFQSAQLNGLTGLEGSKIVPDPRPIPTGMNLIPGDTQALESELVR